MADPAPPAAATPPRDLLGLGCNALVLGLTLLGLLVGCVGWALVAALSTRGTDGVHPDVPVLAAVSSVPSLVAVALTIVGIRRSARGPAARRASVGLALAAVAVIVVPVLAVLVLLQLAPRT